MEVKRHPKPNFATAANARSSLAFSREGLRRLPPFSSPLHVPSMALETVWGGFPLPIRVKAWCRRGDSNLRGLEASPPSESGGSVSRPPTVPGAGPSACPPRCGRSLFARVLAGGATPSPALLAPPSGAFDGGGNSSGRVSPPHLGQSMVPKGGLEPPHPFGYHPLKMACLPVPPLRHWGSFRWLLRRLGRRGSRGNRRTGLGFGSSRRLGLGGLCLLGFGRSGGSFHGDRLGRGRLLGHGK